MVLENLSLSTALLISAIALALSILGSAVTISHYLGQVSGKLDGLNEVGELSTQIATLTQTFDVAAAGRAPENIEDISDGMDEITESLEFLDDVDRSVNNIEAAITAVDLPGIQEAIEDLFKETFDEDSLPIGNSVHYTLEDSGVEVAISLAAFGEGLAQVNIRFDQEVQIGSISQQLAEDDEMADFETRLFGSEPTILSPSPRQLNYKIASNDIDAVAEWIPEMVDKLDEYVIKTTESEKQFDEKVDDALKDTD